MIDIIKDLLTHFFQGANLVIATVALVFIAGYSWWIFAKKPDQKKAKKLVLFSFIIALVAGLAMLVQNRLEQSANTFPAGQMGILVLRFTGDDDQKFQHLLAGALSENLGTGHLTNIVARVSDEQIDPAKLSPAVGHQTARSIGKKYNAQLVVWGDLAGRNGCWAFITVVNQSNGSEFSDEQQLGLQDISLDNPVELVDEPLYLQSFVAGVAAYENGRYAEALGWFESASKFTQTNASEIATLNFCLGSCRIHLTTIQSNQKDLLTTAVDELRSAASSFWETNSPENWAMTMDTLGVALNDQANLSEGAESVRLLAESITDYRAALEVYTREKFPQYWATTQNNLASALNAQARQSQGAEAARLSVESVAAYRAALEVFTRDKFPPFWATTQNNLSEALLAQAAQSKGAEASRLLAESVTANRAALEVFTRELYPSFWAMTQNSLGMGLVAEASHSEGAEQSRLFIEGMAAFHAALEVFTKERFAPLWAKTQSTLGYALYLQASHSKDAEAARLLGESVTAYRAALEIYTPNDFPDSSFGVSNNLAIAEKALQKIRQ